MKTKFFTDILQTDAGKWSLSRLLLIIMFFSIITSWMTGIGEIGGGMIAIFTLLLGYSFGEKIQNGIQKSK